MRFALDTTRVTQLLAVPALALFMLFSMVGCEGILVVPSPEDPVVDLNDPDFYVVREAAKVSFNDMVTHNTPHSEIAIRMPSGVSMSSYANVMNAIPGKVVAAPDAQTSLPLYQIIRIEVRQEDATVVGVIPTKTGPKAVTIDLRHDGLIYEWSWRVVRRQVWETSVDEVRVLYKETDYVPAPGQ